MNLLISLIHREFLRFKDRRSVYIILFGVPLCVYVFLAGIYQSGSIERVSVAVLDLDQSQWSRKVIHSVMANPKLEISHTITSEESLKSFFPDNRDIHGVFYIPKGFQKGIYKGDQQTLEVFTNASNIVFANLLYKESAGIAVYLSKEVFTNRMKGKGVPLEQAQITAAPVRLHYKPLFNPYYNYLYYLLPGLSTVLLQMMVSFLAVRSLNSEYNNLQTLNESCKGNFSLVLLAKWITYSVLGLLVGIYIFVLLHPYFGIPSSVNSWSFMGILFLFILSNTALALAISAWIQKEAVALDVAFVYHSPAFVFSGFTYPVMSMPVWDAWYAQLNPYTHFLQAYFKHSVMEGSLRYVKGEILVLLVFITLGFVLASAGWMKNTRNPDFSKNVE